MTFKPLYKNFIIVLASRSAFVGRGLISANLIRFDFAVPPIFRANFYWMLPFILIAKIACFYYFDLYRGMWRYTSIADLINIIKAVSVSTLLIFCFFLLKYRFVGYSRSIFLIDWCLTILFVSGFRLAVRFIMKKLEAISLGWSP